MTQDLFVATWDKTTTGPWIARHGLSSADYQSTFDDYAHQGYRLRTVSGYENGGQALYAAIWDKQAGPAWVARHGLTSADYQTAFDQYLAQGYRLRLVNGYSVGGVDHYAALWEKASGPAWAARHGLSAADYQTAFDQFVGQGYRLTWVSVYGVGGQDRYAAIWEKSTGPAWVAHHHQTETAFRVTSAALANQGYELICAGAAAVGGQDLYAGLWQKNANASISYHGMTAGAYQLKFDQLTGQGFAPKFVVGWAGLDPVDVMLRFTMQKQTQSNWCWAATSTSISHFYHSGSAWTQCTVANAQLGRSDCCGTGASGPCNVYGYLDLALQTVGCFVSVNGSVTSYADTEAQILQGRPLGIRVAWSGGGAHFIAATGVEDDTLVWVSDCGSGATSLVDYDTLKTAYRGSGTWTHSYFTQP